jgi:serine/threonine protein phosphatase 1
MVNMIGNADKNEIDLYWKLYSARGAYDDFFDQNYTIPKHYMLFFKKLETHMAIGQYLLVHAGIDFSLSEPLKDIKALTTIRNWAQNYTSSKVNGKTIVHGHQNCTLDETEKAVNSGAKVIPLDTGCVYYGKKKGMGYLSAIRLRDKRLFRQINIEGFE